MGRAVCDAVLAEPDMDLVAAVDPRLSGIDFSQVTGMVAPGLVFSGHVETLRSAEPDVVVDFSTSTAAFKNLTWCAKAKMRAVVGTTGLSEAQLAELAESFDSNNVGCIIAANFSIGAVLMMRLAEIAAPYFDVAEIIELHHENKVDAPSGTALVTAERISAAKTRGGGGGFMPDPTQRETVPGARGARVGAGVNVHSLRIKGMVAHQEVILGTLGQTLTIRHDSFDRSSFMPGVVMAIRAVMGLQVMVHGIDWLIDEKLDRL